MSTSSSDQRSYGVKLVRGPFVRLHPHAESRLERLEDIAGAQGRPGELVSVDLFCGCGGLSFGLDAAGFSPVLGVDSDLEALETWRALFPGLGLEADLGGSEAVDAIVAALPGGIDLIAGGPPCQPFSRAGRSKIRDLVRRGERPGRDGRRDLWQSFLDVVLGVQPRAVLMENVPDMALGDDMRILRTIVDELEGDGYAVHTRLLDAPDHGIPQMRQRLILVALRDGLSFDWPEPMPELVTTGQAIGDLPVVEGGWRPEGGADGYLDYEPDIERPFVALMRGGIHADGSGRLYDHITRPVREDDLEIFMQMDSKTRYSDIDDHLKRYRDDIFDDKYKRLDANQPSRAITAHIAKDGYWYIHPEQHRTLTVREAARLQTFPDRVRFAGPPSAAFRQIGNAVPPRLAERLGCSIVAALERAEVDGPTTREISALLADWFRDLDRSTVPWLTADTPWQVIQGELLLRRASADVIRFAWPLVRKMATVAETLEDSAPVGLIAGHMSKPERATRVLEAAKWYRDAVGEPFADATAMAKNPSVPTSVARLAELVAVADSDGPIIPSQAALRVAARFFGEPVDRVNRLSSGRMALVRLIGGSVLARDNRIARAAHAAVLELGESVCRSRTPLCKACPLEEHCAHASSTVDMPSLL